jgi:hypothetical protein
MRSPLPHPAVVAGFATRRELRRRDGRQTGSCAAGIKAERCIERHQERSKSARRSVRSARCRDTRTRSATEAPAAGVELRVGHLAVLFSDLVGSTAL